MIRKLMTFVGIVCVAAVITEAFAVGLLWYRGQLTPDTLTDVGRLLSGEEAESMSDDDAETVPPSTEELAMAIVRAQLDLDSRDQEAKLLMDMVEQGRVQLSEDRAAFLAEKKAFEERLAALEERWASEGTDQARRILKSQRPEDSYAQLAPLELDEAVMLLRGLPDKTIASILQQFARSNDEQQTRRGREIFEALSRGEPRRSLVDEPTTAGGDGPPRG